MQKITLHNGPLAFSARLFGSDETNPLVVCLHGFPDNADSFRLQINDLVAAGYRVLTPTMRGYEPSSIVAGASYETARLAEDVIAWLEELGIEKVHLLGHDWGAAVAYVAATIAPEKFYSLTTIAVPHPQRFSQEGLRKVPVQRLKSWYMLFNQIPFLSDYIVRRKDWAFLKFLWREWSPNHELSEQRWQNLVATVQQPGVLRAMLSYYRDNVSLFEILGLKKNTMNSLGEIPVPNLGISGEDDGCIDTRVFDYAFLPEDHPAGYRFERIANAGHFAHQERPQLINPLLVSWFEQHTP